MSAELVTRQDAQGIATLTLNRPDKLNALNPQCFVALRAHLDAIAVDASVGCVVLTGAGRSFCAGHDLGAIAPEDGLLNETFEAETIAALEALPQSAIARLHGHCFTGGLELALGCDILIAAESTQLGDTHGQWGLVPVWRTGRHGRTNANRRQEEVSALFGEKPLRFRATGEGWQNRTNDALRAYVKRHRAA